MDKKVVATIGSFDGVHLGHQSLFAQMKAYASSYPEAELLAITFDPYPADVLQKKGEPEHIMPTAVRDSLLRALGLSVHLLHFTPELAAKSAQVFMEEVLHRELGVTDLILGYDNRFGHGAKLELTDYQELGAPLGITVLQAEPLAREQQTFSSTLIKGLIRSGAMPRVTEILSRPFSFFGSVVEGLHLGRKLGYPTANIALSDRRQIYPPHGVYASTLSLRGEEGFEERLEAMLYIGQRPTIGGDLERTIEVHILDFNDNIYGREVRVEVLEQLHPEHKFSSTEALREALQRYEAEVRAYFERSHHLDD